MDPTWILAGCAVATLLITWTTSTAIFVGWILRKMDGLKADILADSQKKHEENREKVDAIRTLVIRHDLLLNSEFNGSGQAGRARGNL